MRRRSKLPGLLVLLALGALATSAQAGEPEALWLKAKDGVELRADLYPAPKDTEKKAPLILLFHQAGSNRLEYGEIAQRLNEWGFHALALDQRSGGDRWGGTNETVKKRKSSTKYLEALPDLEAALDFRDENGYKGKTIVWGSSYSAALVFLLAAEHTDRIDGVLSFSPGEYLGTREDEVRTAAKNVTQPVFVTTPKDEHNRASVVFEALPEKDKTFYIPEEAVHGSSMLVESRNKSAQVIWPEVKKFLKKFRP